MIDEILHKTHNFEARFFPPQKYSGNSVRQLVREMLEVACERFPEDSSEPIWISQPASIAMTAPVRNYIPLDERLKLKKN